jgi:DNA-binding NarL/FixJ family response regulator
MVKALIIEESSEVRGSMRQVLEGRYPFFEIGEAATARDAWRHAKASRVALAFVDVRLPDGSGLDLIRTLSRVLPQANFCVLTEYDLPEYRLAARDRGAGHFLVKGTSTSADVIEVVDAMLASRIRALIVDDDPGRRRTFADNLSARWPAMIVVDAVDPVQASSIAPVLKPDLTFVEARLLEASAGLSVTLKAANATAVVVALTPPSSPDDRRMAPRAGADYPDCAADALDTDIAGIVRAAMLRH